MRVPAKPFRLAAVEAALAILVASAALAAPRPAWAQAYGGGLAPVPGTAIDDELRQQLAAWRTRDLSGLACAHCHAPDASDLAMFAISDDDILRRASFHVGPDDAQSILALVARMRAQHVAEPRDRFAARPFQPGGEVLPGATHVERDAAFAAHLAKRLPTLSGERISTVAQAFAAKDEVLGYDLRNEPLGIPFPRWSEDGFHGDEHGTLHDWLPDVSPVPANDDDAAVLFALHDAYIEAPTPEALWAIQAHNDAFGVPSSFAGSPLPGTNAAVLGRRKHASMLAGQHLLRMEHAGVPIATPVGRPVVMRPNFNRFNFPFDIGSRLNQSTMRPTRADFPAPILAGLTGGRGDSDQAFREMLVRELMLSWWMVGWVLEPGLQSIPNWHEYFPQSLVGHRDSRQPYMMHRAFITTTMALHRTYTAVPEANGLRRYPSLLRFRETGANPGFTFAGAGLWASPGHEAAFRRFAANATRMELLLLTAEAEEACASGAPYAANAYSTTDLDILLENWTAGAAAIDPDAAAMDAEIAWNAFDALARWKRGCTPPPPPGTGAGLDVVVSTASGAAASAHDPARLSIAAPASGVTHAVFAGGTLTPRFTGPMRFDVDHGNNYATAATRLWIGGALAYEEIDGAITARPWITVAGGVPVTMRLEYDRTRGTGLPTRVRWESAQEFTTVIPSAQLDGLASSPQYLAGDLDLNGVVDGRDLAIVLANWNAPAVPIPDLDGDGDFDGGDLATVLGSWGTRW